MSRFDSQYVTGLLALLVANLLGLAAPALIKVILDGLTPDVTPEWLATVCAVGVGIYAARALASYTQRIALGTASERMTAEARARAFAHVLDRDLSFHASYPPGQLSALVHADTAEVVALTCATLPSALSLGLTIAGTGVALVVLAPELALLALAPLPVLAILAVLFERRVRAASQGLARSRGDIYASVHEALTGAEGIAIAGAADLFERRLDDATDTYLDDALGLLRHRSLLFPALDFTLSSVMLAALATGGYFIAQGDLTTGAVVAFYAYVARALAPIRTAPSLLYSWHRARAARERLDRALTPPDARDAKGHDPLPPREAPLRARDVTFSYHPDDPARSPALDGLNLELAPGARVAILGPSGAGKSTLGRLFALLVAPQSGELLVGDTPLSRIDPDAWLPEVGYVGQQVFLFDAPLRENILLGNPTPDDELALATRVACVDDMLGADLSLDSSPGFSGRSLSGGQQKRVALARALCRRPRLLIIDQLASDLEEPLNRRIFEGIRAHYDLSILYLGHRVPAGFAPDAVFWLEGGSLAPRDDLV
jgi:ATP-binding cassette subfamily B protein AbcA/BmrA